MVWKISAYTPQVPTVIERVALSDQAVPTPTSGQDFNAALDWEKSWQDLLRGKPSDASQKKELRAAFLPNLSK